MSLSLFKEKNVPIALLLTTAIFIADLFTKLWYDLWLLSCSTVFHVPVRKATLFILCIYYTAHYRRFVYFSFG